MPHDVRRAGVAQRVVELGPISQPVGPAEHRDHHLPDPLGIGTDRKSVDPVAPVHGPESHQVPFGGHNVHQFELACQSSQHAEFLAHLSADFDRNRQLLSIFESEGKKRVSRSTPSGKWLDEEIEPFELREVEDLVTMGDREVGGRAVVTITDSGDLNQVSVES